MMSYWFNERVTKLMSINRAIKNDRRNCHGCLASESGSSLVELALVLQLLLLVLVVLVDLGRAYYYAISISSAADAAAVYGLKNPTDLNGIQLAASASASDIPTLTTSASYGCECHDGSSVVVDCSAPPLCSDNYVNYVATTTTVTFTPLLPYPGIPASFTLQRSARLRSGGD
jgi:Flp pilus assembly protein TadG